MSKITYRRLFTIAILDHYNILSYYVCENSSSFRWHVPPKSSDLIGGSFCHLIPAYLSVGFFLLLSCPGYICRSFPWTFYSPLRIFKSFPNFLISYISSISSIVLQMQSLFHSLNQYWYHFHLSISEDSSLSDDKSVSDWSKSVIAFSLILKTAPSDVVLSYLSSAISLVK